MDPYFVAAALMIGDAPRRLDWFEKAYEEGAPGLLGIRHNPWLKRSLGHPRFQKIIRSIKYPPPFSVTARERPATR